MTSLSTSSAYRTRYASVFHYQHLRSYASRRRSFSGNDSRKHFFNDGSLKLSFVSFFSFQKASPTTLLNIRPLFSLLFFTSIISAMIETAISSGVSALIFNPIGVCTRSKSSLSIPFFLKLIFYDCNPPFTAHHPDICILLFHDYFQTFRIVSVTARHYDKPCIRVTADLCTSFLKRSANDIICSGFSYMICEFRTILKNSHLKPKHLPEFRSRSRNVSSAANYKTGILPIRSRKILLLPSHPLFSLFSFFLFVRSFILFFVLSKNPGKNPLLSGIFAAQKQSPSKHPRQKDPVPFLILHKTHSYLLSSADLKQTPGRKEKAASSRSRPFFYRTLIFLIKSPCSSYALANLERTSLRSS